VKGTRLLREKRV